MYLAMFETRDNQRYVFASPRLKENTGAFYLLTLLEPWVRNTSQYERILILDVSVSSGRVIVTVGSEKDTHSLMNAVTRKVLEAAPGTDVTGVFTPMISVHATREDLESVRTASAHYALIHPPTPARLCSTPFLEPGHDAPLPAVPSRVGFPSGKVYSLPGTVTRAQASKARGYLLGLVSTHPYLSEQSEELLPNPDALEKTLDSLSKVAVIHLGGNDMGATVHGLTDRLNSIPVSIFQGQIKCDASGADALRLSLLKLNKRLDNVIKNAFYDAWTAVTDLAIQEGVDVVLVVPVILGSDDAAVITSNAFAIPFAVAFLEAFKERTGTDPFISSLSDDGRMTADASVTVMRRNFPFYPAYDLAERLAPAARAVDKRMDESCSTLSYRILYDSTVLDPEELLASYTPFTNEAETTQSVPAMTSRPYRILARKELSAPFPPSTMNESWDAMRLHAAWFTGILSAPGAPIPMRFPKSRAARIHKILSDAVHLSNREQRSHLAKTRSEWNDARSQHGLKVLVDAIGSERLILDLIDLVEIPPRTYLIASAPEGLS